MREGPAIGFKTTIVLSNNVAPSILRLVCGGDREGAGRARGRGLIVLRCVKALIISALLVLVA